MNYKTHKVAGICTGLIASNVFLEQGSPEIMLYSTLLIGGSYIGSTLPDIDHPNSRIGRHFKIVNRLCGHRGLIHSPLFTLILSFFLLFIGMYLEGYTKLIYAMFAIGLIIGYISHIFIDSLTKSGVPLFYPVSRKMYGLKLFKTSKHELLVSFLTIFITYCLLNYVL